MRKNKKATLSELLLTFFILIVMIFIMIAFNWLFKFGGQRITDIIEGESKNIESKEVLLNLLRMPVNINDEKLSMADLIVKGYYNHNYKEKVEESLKSTLDKFLETKNFGCYKLTIGNYLPEAYGTQDMSIASKLPEQDSSGSSASSYTLNQYKYLLGKIPRQNPCLLDKNPAQALIPLNENKIIPIKLTLI